MIVKLLSTDDLKSVDVSNFYHSSNWVKIIEESHELKPFLIGLVDNKKLVNVIPFFLIKSNFFGKKLVSLPYGDYGGFLFSNLKMDWILKKLDNIAKENDVDYVEIRESLL